MSSPLLKLSRLLADVSLSHNFAIEIEGRIDSSFYACSGLEETITYKRIKEVNSKIGVNIPTGITWPDLVLRKGVTVSETLFDMYKEFRDWRPGDPDYRKAISIVQLKWIDNTIPVEVDRWDFEKCAVSHYKGPVYDANQTGRSQVEISIKREAPLEKPYSSKVADVAALLSTFSII